MPANNSRIRKPSPPKSYMVDSDMMDEDAINAQAIADAMEEDESLALAQRM